jgi:Arc/MetJ family transcription regulator
MSAPGTVVPPRSGPATAHTSIHLKVYALPMTRTNIEIDDDLVGRAMSLYRLRSKREAVDLALRKLVGEPMGRAEMLAAEGSGWAGDLDEIRAPEEVPEP